MSAVGAPQPPAATAGTAGGGGPQPLGAVGATGGLAPHREGLETSPMVEGAAVVTVRDEVPLVVE